MRGFDFPALEGCLDVVEVCRFTAPGLLCWYKHTALVKIGEDVLFAVELHWFVVADQVNSRVFDNGKKISKLTVVVAVRSWCWVKLWQRVSDFAHVDLTPVW